jgi:mannose-1-phosphate guanylyltransferase
MADSHRHALILAGGRGTRFWPRSRRARAKQVLDFLGAGTLIQQTVERLTPVVGAERIWVLTNALLRDEIVRQLPQVPKRQIIAEPVGRNTAPAIALAARIMQDVDPDAVMGVFPSDQFVAKPAPFRKLLKAAYKTAEQGAMALIGIAPRWPETGYGYLEFPKGAAVAGSTTPTPVVRFREKPDAALAEQFVAAGHFAWNAGIFFWRADVFLAEMWKYQPKTAALLDGLPKFGSRVFSKRLAELFPQCENISVDYAVLEKADGVVGFAAGDVGWSDVGSFNAVYELLARDADENASRGKLLSIDAHGNYVDVPDKIVALIGVDDLVVVDTPDALLVTRRSHAQRVGEAVKLVEAHKRDDLL